MSTPLDKKQVACQNESSNAEKTLPALHPKWVEKVEFVSYQAPPVDLTDKGQYEEWRERLRFIEEDLHWLLQLPHDRFWCQVVFDETLHKLIDTYLRFSPRSFNVVNKLPEESKEMHNEIHRLVFMTCLRMATHKESKENFITPSVFGEILYENFLFDIPKLFDLCVLYGQGNGALLSKMLENIFTQQPKYEDDLVQIIDTMSQNPKYEDDLVQTIDTISQVFDAILTKCGIKVGTGSPQKISESNSLAPSLVTMEMSEFEDLIMYLYDISVTLTSFLQVYPAACQTFHDSEFIQQLPSFYDAVIPAVFSALKQREIDPSDKTLLKSKVTEAKKRLLSLFQTIMSHCCIQPILEKSGNTGDYIEDYMHVLASILGDRRFLADYESLYSLHEDLDILAQAMPDIDETRLQYIHDAVNSAFATYGKRKSPKGAMNRGGRRSPDGSPGPEVGGATGGKPDVRADTDGSASGGPSHADSYQVDNMDDYGACAKRITGIELESLITSVKDLLPYLGDGFIELCLEEFNYEIEKVINAVLEDKLPPSLQEIDRQLDRETPEEPPRTLLSERKNIFDYDEFDVFNRSDIDTSKMKIGKKDKTEDIIIGDKGMKDLKSNIVKDYGVVIDTVIVEGNQNDTIYSRDEYDDEYDDTYDTNVVGADDADSADELTNIRPFSTPRVLQEPGRGAVEDDGSESEEEDDKPKWNRDHFVQDPALLRQRAEERAQYKANRQQNKGQGPKKHDVKGGPKGQGQSDEVMRNRRWKTQHKGDYRRQQADKKRRV